MLTKTCVCSSGRWGYDLDKTDSSGNAINQCFCGAHLSKVSQNFQPLVHTIALLTRFAMLFCRPKVQDPHQRRHHSPRRHRRRHSRRFRWCLLRQMHLHWHHQHTAQACAFGYQDEQPNSMPNTPCTFYHYTNNTYGFCFRSLAPLLNPRRRRRRRCRPHCHWWLHHRDFRHKAHFHRLHLHHHHHQAHRRPTRRRRQGMPHPA